MKKTFVGFFILVVLWVLGVPLYMKYRPSVLSPGNRTASDTQYVIGKPINGSQFVWAAIDNDPVSTLYKCMDVVHTEGGGSCFIPIGYFKHETVQSFYPKATGHYYTDVEIDTPTL